MRVISLYNRQVKYKHEVKRLSLGPLGSKQFIFYKAKGREKICLCDNLFRANDIGISLQMSEKSGDFTARGKFN